MENMLKYNSKARSEFTDNGVNDVEECAYVSRKISKIRWKPEGLDDYSTHFITGSYDDPRVNGLDLWSFTQRPEPELQQKCEFAPELQGSLKLSSCIKEVCFLEEKDHFAYCSNDSNIGIVKVSSQDSVAKLEQVCQRDLANLSRKKDISFSCMDTYENALAAASYGGTICLLSADVNTIIGSIDNSIPCSSIKFVSNCELVTGSLLGTVAIWDLRSNYCSPAQLFPLSRLQRVGMTCGTVFPTEKHMLVCGGRNGTISVFDTRNLPVPVRVFNTTEEPISELRFHPTHHSVLYSVSSRGTIWQWTNFFQLFDPLRILDIISPDSNNGQRVMLEYKAVPPEVKCLMKNDKFHTNSIDLDKDRLICGTDNECIIVIKSLQLK